MNGMESDREYMYLRGERRFIGVRSYRLSLGSGLAIIILVVVICVELWVIGFGLLNWLRSRVVVGKWEVRVSGCGNEDAMEIQRKVEMYLRGRGIFFDIDGLRRYLENWWRFSELRIKKELSGVVNVGAKKGKPFAYLISGGGWALDENGDMIEEISSFKGEMGNNTLPVIYIEDVNRGEGIVKEGIKVIKEVKLHEESDDVEIRLLRYDGVEKAFFIGLGSIMLEVSKEGVEEELRKYYKYRDEVGKMLQEGQVLDLRFRGQIIIKQEERIKDYGKKR